jgi:hypothetical protein
MAVRPHPDAGIGMTTVEDKRGPRIAVIGFGSLIWRIRSRSGKLKLRSMWHKDGPFLPVEYARKSENGRLTLVIVPGVTPQRTLWAYSAFDNLDDAKENLRKREGKNVESQYISKWGRGVGLDNDSTAQTIAKWAAGKELLGVVWTALPPKDKFGRNNKMTAEEALEYLSSLKDYKRKVAKEYVTKAPSQIDTKIRRLARVKLGWSDYQLSKDLFEN